METIEAALSIAGDRSQEKFFGKPPQQWQHRNGWTKPKRKRNRAKAQVEIDLWSEEG